MAFKLFKLIHLLCLTKVMLMLLFTTKRSSGIPLSPDQISKYR